MYICSAVRKRVTEGTKSPLFLYFIMIEETVRGLIEEGLKTRSDLFLIDFSISENNAIKVTIDGDSGVKVEDCVFISRSIEHNLDREETDFSLEVSSAGATSPLTHIRQYKKHVGRKLEVRTTASKKIEADLVDVNDEGITLNWKAREPKPVGKGKRTVQKEAVLKYDEIEQAKVKIKF